MNNTWCTIESDPGVFTELIEGLGVKDVEVQEIFSLDDTEYLLSLGKIYGFIFLFKWTKETNQKKLPNYECSNLFFAQQVIQDACATQALLSILLNNPSIELGENMNNFREFCIHLDPYSRGLAIGESDHIRTIHNSFAKQEPFVFQKVKSDKEEDAFHFISYINYNDSLLELDGLQKGPFCHQNGLQNSWIENVKEVIQKRILLYSEKEIRFNLLVVVESQKNVFSKKLYNLEMELFPYYNLLSEKGNNKFANFEFQTEFDKNNLKQIAEDIEENFLEAFLLDKCQSIINKINNIRLDLKDYTTRREKQKKENQRRKTNYLPLIFELFKKSAEKGTLLDMYNKAKK
jgi:ubiquitin carboxyl-terminal hydrolase L5